MNKWTKSCFLLVFLGLCSCKTITKVPEVKDWNKITVGGLQLGKLNCFEAGVKDDEGNPIYCETSAVVQTKADLLIANDKSMPAGYSSVFHIPSNTTFPVFLDQSNVQLDTQSVFREVRKIESFTTTPDQKMVLAATAFDRIMPDDNSWDGYNAILYWKNGKRKNIQYLMPSIRDGKQSSRGLRAQIKAALQDEAKPDGFEYFKIEGMAVTPDFRLLLGIREIGASYKNPTYTFTILAAPLKKQGKKLEFASPLKKLYSYDTQSHPSIESSLGLSSMEYFPLLNSLIVMTSFEGDGEEKSVKLATYFWVLPLDHLDNGKAPYLMKGQGGEVFSLPHKGEGMTIIDDKNLFIICDEDRKASSIDTREGTFERAPNEAVFANLKIRW